MKYFENFPTIDYNDVKVKNLLVRVKLLERAKNERSVYHPFTIEDGETAEKIAYDYYGDVNATWLIYLINGIVDPYYDWPLSTVQFEAHIRKKYGSLSAAQSNILFYRKIPSKYYVSISDPNDFRTQSNPPADPSRYRLVEQDGLDIRMSIESYTRTPDANFLPVTAYDEEVAGNERKRNIKLLDRSYKDAVDSELKKLLTA